MSRQDQYSLSVVINGVNTGIWDKLDGGEKDSEESKYSPGGLQPQVSLGGTAMVTNLTLSRLYKLDRDHSNIHQWLNLVGRAAVVITKQPLDLDGNAFGRPIVYTGVLKQVSPPEVDSESNDAALVAIEVTPDGNVG